MACGCPGCCLGRLFRLAAGLIGVAVILGCIFLGIEAFRLFEGEPRPLSLPDASAGNGGVKMLMGLYAEVLNPRTDPRVIQTLRLSEKETNELIVTLMQQNKLLSAMIPPFKAGGLRTFSETFGKDWAVRFTGSHFLLTAAKPIPYLPFDRYLNLSAEWVPFKTADAIQIRLDALSVGSHESGEWLRTQLESDLNARLVRLDDRGILQAVDWEIKGGELWIHYRPGLLRQILFNLK